VDSLNVALAGVIEIVVGFITKILCLLDPTSVYVGNKESGTGNMSAIGCVLSCFKCNSDDFVCGIITDDKRWVCQCDWEFKKTIHLNIIIPLLPEKKIQDSTFCWKMHVHLFSGLQRHIHKEYMVKV